MNRSHSSNFLFPNPTTASSTTHSSTFLTPAAVISRYGISRQTLRRWAASGRIECIQMPGGKHLYRATDIERIFGNTQHQQQPQKTDILYARVSSEHQRADLERQIADLRAQYAAAELISDIGSGINWHCRGFQNLLERVEQGEVARVVVTVSEWDLHPLRFLTSFVRSQHKDRLARFAMELIEWIFRRANVQLVVLGQPDHPSAERELADDLLSIVTVFVAKHNGQRSAENRRRSRAAEDRGEENSNQESQDDEETKDGQGASGEGEEDSVVSEQAAEGDTHALAWQRPVDVQRVPRSRKKRKHTSQQEGAASKSSQ